MLSRVSQETSRPIVAMAEASKTPTERVRHVAAALAQRGYVTIEAQTVIATESGRQVAASLEAAQEEGLNELLEGWAPHDHPDVEALVAEISKRLNSEDSAMLHRAPAHPTLPSPPSRAARLVHSAGCFSRAQKPPWLDFLVAAPVSRSQTSPLYLLPRGMSIQTTG